MKNDAAVVKSAALTLEQIRALHAPLTDRPQTGLNQPCLCPVCAPRPQREPVK